MAKSNRYALKFRRRREGKTNYHKRLALLQSRKPRLVIRKTNTSVIVQVVEYAPDGDVIRAAFCSAKLPSLGWTFNCANIPAAYLTGFIVGKAALKAGVSEVIVDVGMQVPHHKGKLFAAVKGVLDAGLVVPVDEKVIPDDSRLSGAHISPDVAKLVDSIKKKVD